MIALKSQSARPHEFLAQNFPCPRRSRQKAYARPGSQLWPRSKAKWKKGQYWDSPLKAIARQLANAEHICFTKCQRAVFRELVDKWNRKLKFAFCSIEHLQKVSGFSRRGIQYAIQSLEALGLLFVDRSQTKYKTSVYMLRFRAIENALETGVLIEPDIEKYDRNRAHSKSKVHPNIISIISSLFTLRSEDKLALEIGQSIPVADMPDMEEARIMDEENRYKAFDRQIKAEILSSGGEAIKLMERYYLILGEGPLDNEVRAHLHHETGLVVAAVLHLLNVLDCASQFIIGSFTSLIHEMEKTYVCNS